MGLNQTSFKKGQSGNPKGKPKVFADIQALARASTRENLERLQYWRDQDLDPQVSLRAAQYLHEIGWGKPSQSVQVTGAEGGPLTCTWMAPATLHESTTIVPSSPRASASPH